MKTQIKLKTVLLVTTTALLLSGCAISVVKPGYMGIKYRPLGSGLVKEKIYDDGIVWKWFWNRVFKYNVQWQTYTENVDILTQDDLHTTITVSAILRPKVDELGQLVLEIGREYYKKIVQPEFYTVTRSTFSRNEYMELSEKSPDIEKEIISELKKRLEGYHIELSKVTINHINYSKIVTEATDVKLATKQKIEQKDYEIKIAEKDAEIQRALAKGQKDAQKTIDEGLTSKYLQFKALQVQEKLTTSPNAKFYFVPLGKDGIPIIVDTEK